MISDRKMETLKEALKKKHVGTEQEISLLFLEGLKGFFFFFSKLGAKKGKSNAGTPVGHSRESSAAPRCGFCGYLTVNPLVLVWG